MVVIERDAWWALLGVLLLCAGCSSGPSTLDMMPGPTYHRAFEVREFGDAPSEEVPPRIRMLYATDREPAVEGDDEPFYANERGGELRVLVRQAPRHLLQTQPQVRE